MVHVYVTPWLRLISDDHLTYKYMTGGCFKGALHVNQIIQSYLVAKILSSSAPLSVKQQCSLKRKKSQCSQHSLSTKTGMSLVCLF